jgi:hypothetical protein
VTARPLVARGCDRIINLGPDVVPPGSRTRPPWCIEGAALAAIDNAGQQADCSTRVTVEPFGALRILREALR